MNVVRFPRPRDFGLEAQKAAEAHLSECYRSLWGEDEGDADIESPALGGAFCGCDTCIVREVLSAAWPLLLLAARADIEDGL